MRTKAAVAGILAALLMAALGGCENPASGGDAEAVVTIAAIAGVTAPVTGGMPVTGITETAQYTGAVTWGPGDATFEASTVYTATIRVAPKSGFTLAGVPENFFTLAGSNSATNPANSGVVTAVFPATGGTPGKPTVIDIAAIAGVRVPVTGEKPVTGITETAQYTGAVTWEPDHGTFEAYTGYTATITLTPKSGFTLAGVRENFFILAGATATNAADSGVVSAVFPATGAVPVTVSALDLTGLISAPVKNAAPVTEFTAQAQYTGTIAWYTETDDPIEGNFAASTVYKAVLTLTANEGYTFTGVGADSFTYTGGTSVTNPADSGTVTITFPATAPALPSISGSLSKETSSGDLGAKDTWLTSGFSGVTVELWTEDGDEDTPDTLVKRITTTGSRYSFSDVYPGTYRIKAEKGPYDFVSPEVAVEADPVTQDIDLALFPGLKLTVKVSPGSSEFILPVTYVALLTNRPEVDLNVDWGDGTGSGLDTAPASTAEAAYTHDYADALGGSEGEFTLRITGKCFGITDNKVAFGFYETWSMASGDISTLEGFLATGNRNKILKAAGNITALTGGRTRSSLNNQAYRGLFYACENLEDVSSLVFTDELDGTESTFMVYAFSKTKITGFPVFPDVTQGSNSFLSHTFEGCTNITGIPEFLSNIASSGSAFLDYAFAGTGITEIPADFLANITVPGGYFLRGTFKGCTNLTTTNNGFIAKAVPGAAILGFLNNTFEDCTNLSYIDIGAQTASEVSDPNDQGQRRLMIHAFTNVGTASAEGVTIRIHYTGKALKLRPNDAYNDETLGLDTAKVKEIQVPQALMADYQNNEYWGGEIGVKDSAKIVPLHD